MGLEKLINREIKITIGVVLFVSVLFITLSYAIFKVDKSGASDVIKFGDISLSFCQDATCASNVSNIGNIIGTETDSNGNTVYSKIYPTSDPVTNDDWNNLKPYIFTLKNTGSLPLYVSIFLERDMTAGTLSDGTSEYSEFVSDDQVKIGFGVQGETPTIGLYSDYLNTTDNNHKIASNIQIGVGETKIFNLYAWLKSDAENASLGKYFVTQISARGEYLPDGENTEVDENLKTIEIDFKEGTIDKNIKQVQKGNSVEFTLTPSDTSVTLDKLNITCLSGTVPTVSGNTLTISNVQKNEFCQVYSIPTLLSKILTDNPTRDTRTDFSTVYTTTTTGTLFSSTESIAGSSPVDVYYYAGATTNNWVKFAGFYWRIIRTNHDSSIRLIYVGETHDTTNGNIGSSSFNANYNSTKYVGYKYGEDTSLDTIRKNTTDSTIKLNIDTWYENNLVNYTKYLSKDAVYCNDRSLASGATYSTTSAFDYASHERIRTNKQPTYNCVDIRDAFSVNNTSAKLDYPIALMTTDEMVFAGGSTSRMSTPYAWFNSNSVENKVSLTWWLMTPENSDSNISISWRWYSYNSGDDYLISNSVHMSYSIRPVISLKSCVKWASGDGTVTNPYTIEEAIGGC